MREPKSERKGERRRKGCKKLAFKVHIFSHSTSMQYQACTFSSVKREYESVREKARGRERGINNKDPSTKCMFFSHTTSSQCEVHTSPPS